MTDLQELNRRIATHILGRDLKGEERAYLDDVPLCVGRIRAEPQQIRDLLGRLSASVENLPQVLYVNRDYLNYARLAAKDAAAGNTEKLIQLGINISTARVLASLSNEEVTKLARCWAGVIVSVDEEWLQCGLQLHPSARRLHASAFLNASRMCSTHCGARI